MKCLNMYNVFQTLKEILRSKRSTYTTPTIRVPTTRLPSFR